MDPVAKLRVWDGNTYEDVILTKDGCLYFPSKGPIERTERIRIDGSNKSDGVEVQVVEMIGE